MHFTNVAPASVPRWLVLGSVISAVIQVFLALPLMPGEYFERISVARTLASRAEFADPFTALPTGPTTHVSPIYPIFVAVVFQSLGEAPGGAVFLILMCILMHSLYPILIFAFAARFFGDPGVPTAASAIAVLIPHFPPMVSVETIYLVDCLLGSFLCTWRLLALGPPTVWSALKLGILGAICGLLNASAIVLWLVWIAFLCWRSQLRGRKLFATLIITATCFLVTVSPWVVRNYMVFGVPIILRGNLGFELSLSNRDGSAPTTLQNHRNGFLARWHPNFSRSAAEQLRREGEVAYNRRKMDEARDWILHNPLKFVSLTVERFWFFWFPPFGDAVPVYVISLWMLTLASAAGVAMLWRDRNPFLPFALGIYIAYPALLYLIQASLVYTLPIVWLHVICGGYLIASIPRVRREILSYVSPQGSIGCLTWVFSQSTTYWNDPVRTTAGSAL